MKLMYIGDAVHAIAEPLVEVGFLFAMAALVLAAGRRRDGPTTLPCSRWSPP